LGEFWRLKDLGDLELSNKTIEQVYNDLLRVIEENYKNDELSLFMGGDHIITYLCIKAVKRLLEGNGAYYILFSISTYTRNMRKIFILMLA